MRVKPCNKLAVVAHTFFIYFNTYYAWSVFPQVVQKPALGEVETKTFI